MRRLRVVVFVKAPRLGAVKTRLARDIGAFAAWRFHRETAFRVARRLVDPRWELVLATTPDDLTWMRGWPRSAIRSGQGGGDLGARMRRALAVHGPTVLVGGDIPDVRRSHVAAAFRAMRAGAGLVFGPAADGGFWLAGVRERPSRELFAGARWSTRHALADVLAGLPKTARVGFVATLADVDDGAAYRAWRGST